VGAHASGRTQNLILGLLGGRLGCRRFVVLLSECIDIRRATEGVHPTPCQPAWHSLRHFAVSCWIEAGLAPKTVQTFVGHATLQMTMDTYGHMFPSEDHSKAMDAIAKGLFT
jgi:integrase